MLLDHTYAGLNPAIVRSDSRGRCNHELCHPLLNGLKAIVRSDSGGAAIMNSATAAEWTKGNRAIHQQGVLQP
jgi:hypothetical protein